MKTKLTLTAIRKFEPKQGADGKLSPAFLWSKDISGLGVKATPAGRKVFIFQYRPKHQAKKEKTAPIRLTLGVFGKDLTLHQAEVLARNLRLKVQSGQDPREALQLQREEQERASVRTIAALTRSS